MKIIFLIVACVFALALIIPNTFAVKEPTENKTRQDNIILPEYLLNKELQIKGEFFYNDPPKPIHTYRFPFNYTNATLLGMAGEQREGISAMFEGIDGLFEIKIPKNFPLSNTPVNTGKEIIVLNNGMEILPKLTVTDCFYEYSFSIENSTTIEMIPAYHPTFAPFVAQDVPDYCLEKTIAEYDHSYISPLKQFKDGVAVDEIICKNNLFLTAKSSDGSPTCVTYHTGLKLLERGWATCDDEIFYGRGHPCGVRSSPGIADFESEQETKEYSPATNSIDK